MILELFEGVPAPLVLPVYLLGSAAAIISPFIIFLLLNALDFMVAYELLLSQFPLFPLVLLAVFFLVEWVGLGILVLLGVRGVPLDELAGLDTLDAVGSWF